MFSGIIEEVGEVKALERKASDGPARLVVKCDAVLADTEKGASIAVNGTCLTVVELGPGWFAADLAVETLKRTNLGDLRGGSLVNLERALLPAKRLDGHFVQGHVDATGDLIALDQITEDHWWLRIRIPKELDRYIVMKGSIAIDGISLTVASLDKDVMGITIIPHTFFHTALRDRVPGSRLNLEADLIAKHIEKLLQARA